MRSGQYKLSSCKSLKNLVDGSSEVTSGQFRKTLKDPHFPSFVSIDNTSESASASIYVGSLHIKPFYQSSDVVCPSTENLYPDKNFSKDDSPIKSLNSRHKRKELIYRHRSCENITSAKQNCNHYPHSYNQYDESQVLPSFILNDSRRENRIRSAKVSGFNGIEVENSNLRHKDLWQASKFLTIQRKLRLSASYSHSALHTISSNIASDSVSCLSGSSGYSSSNSSSYGSFKSCGSPVSSALPRNRHGSCGSPTLPITDHIDNPLYDILPINISLPSSISTNNDSPYSSLQLSGETIAEVVETPESNHCEFLRKRLEASELLKKKWSLTVSQPEKRYKRHKKCDLKLISKGDAVVDSKFNVGLESEMRYGVESNYGLIDDDDDDDDCENSDRGKRTTTLDIKMNYLRREIASLIDADATLVKQLIHLHQVISSLKSSYTYNEYPTLDIPIYANISRPGTPSDQDSLTEEDVEEIERNKAGIKKLMGAILETKSEINLNQPQNSKENNQQTFPNVSKVHHEKLHTTVSNSNKKIVASKVFSKSTNNVSSFKCRKGIHGEEEEDEGHGTDFSSISYSPSPASTLSSKSSSKSSYSRRLFHEIKSDLGASFTRCRKSYAPNARNRRRASSLHHHAPSHNNCSGLLSPDLECGRTTALVVIHRDDEISLLNSVGSGNVSEMTALPYDPVDALSYTKYREAAKNAKKFDEDISEISPHKTTIPLADEQNSTSLLSLPGDLCTQKSTTHHQRSEHLSTCTNQKPHNEALKPISKISSSTSLMHGSCSSQTATSSPLCPSTRPGYREALIM